MINLDKRKSTKRPYEKTTEFLPLSKGNIFESNDDNSEYDWGCKKVAKKSHNNENIIDKKTKTEDSYQDSIRRKDVYKTDDPLKLKEEDKAIYLDNLSKIYQRNLVYIPSFYHVDDAVSNINNLIDGAVADVFTAEAQRLSDLLDNLWQPLYDSYIKTERLSKDCNAYKMIVTGVEQYTKARAVYENCRTDFKSNSANFKEVAETWKNMEVDRLTIVFNDAVGSILLKYKDDVSATLVEMAQEKNAAVFMRMVNDSVETVRERVEKAVAVRKKKMNSKKKDEEENSEDEKEAEETGDMVNNPVSADMMKNRGIVPYRKKTNKNPRLKHRLKYKKAVVRQQSQVARARNDAGNYQGEASGIKVGLVKAKKMV